MSAHTIMAGTTIRVSDETRRGLRELEELTGLGPQEIVSRAVEQLRRKLILEQTGQAYARAREAGDSLEELTEWEVALPDGREQEPPWEPADGPDAD